MAYKKLNLLLISSSMPYRKSYLNHAIEEMHHLLNGIKEIVFIPYAKKDWDGYCELFSKRMEKEGFKVKSIHKFSKKIEGIIKASSFFVGGGNTFLLLKRLYDYGLLKPLRERILNGVPYIGSSAGSNIVGLTIGTTNDMPIVYPPSFNALGILPFNINPHYCDPPSKGVLAGETRDERLIEFLNFNPQKVVALREEAILRVKNGEIKARGGEGVKVFSKKGNEIKIEEYKVGDDLSFLFRTKLNL